MINNSPPASKSVDPCGIWPPIAADDLPANILLPRLRNVTRCSQQQWAACCPAHPDSRPSLSITEVADFRLLICCHYGCTAEEIMTAVGLHLRDLFARPQALRIAQSSGKRKPPSLGRGRTHDIHTSVRVDEDEVGRLTRQAEAAHASAVAKGFLRILAEQLRLPLQALIDFRVGYEVYIRRTKWVFVERDHCGRVVGLIRRDHDDGSKICVPGGRRGLIFALQPATDPIKNSSAPLYIPEGHTDTIALHGAGCITVGRPAARLSGAGEIWLLNFLQSCPHLWRARPIIVVGDNDPAGIDGAAATADGLREALGKHVFLGFPPPPHKDMRDWIASGGFRPGWPLFAREERP